MNSTNVYHNYKYLKCKIKNTNNKIWQNNKEMEVKQKSVVNLLIFHSRKTADTIKLEKILVKNKNKLKLIFFS